MEVGTRVRIVKGHRDISHVGAIGIIAENNVLGLNKFSVKIQSQGVMNGRVIYGFLFNELQSIEPIKLKAFSAWK